MNAFTTQGKAEVKVKLAKATLTVTVSTPMMIVLDLFNDSDELSCTQIIQTSSLGEKEVKQALFSLACVTYPKATTGGLLRRVRINDGGDVDKKAGTERIIRDEDIFAVNQGFHSKWKKLTIPTRPYPVPASHKPQ